MLFGTEVGLGPGDVVLDGLPCPEKREHSPSRFRPMSTVAKQLDQDATWYGGRPRPRRHYIRWGVEDLPPPKGAQPPIFGQCLLWPNGWMHQERPEIGLSPGDIVLDGDPALPPQRGTAPNFRPMSVVAKRLDG